jgi:hypothetical protein
MNRTRERIPRRLRRGVRAAIMMRLNVLTDEDPLQLAAGFFKSSVAAPCTGGLELRQGALCYAAGGLCRTRSVTPHLPAVSK